MDKIGIIADDLTGGTTVGTLLARSNINTAVYFSAESIVDAEDKEAIVLTSDSRALDTDEAKFAVSTCMNELKEQGAKYFTKRIDTTLRGGIGHEIDAMLDLLPEDTIAVMVPAMPQSNRIVVGGYSVIDGTALSKTNVSNDVLTPVNESHVPTMIKKQSQNAIGQIDLGTLLAGKNSFKRVLEEIKENQKRIIICDAISMDEIKMVAESIVELGWNILAVDPGPFTQELSIARGFGKNKIETQLTTEEPELEVDGKILVVAGSATQNTKDQLTKLNEFEQVEMISANPERLVDLRNSEKEIQKISQKVVDYLEDEQTNVAIVETSISHPVLDLKAVEKELNLNKGEASININKGLAKIVGSALQKADDVKGIYLTGGDTMVITLKELGASGIELIDYVIPQTDLGKIIGGKFDGLLTIGKGGLTGNINTAIQAVNKIHAESKKELNKV